tara:strand:- start:246 stop:458 length:213 start_codon:yes stop_codon:yes gene_type:complete
VGVPLLSRVQAHAVGLKAQRISGDVMVDIASIRARRATPASSPRTGRGAPTSSSQTMILDFIVAFSLRCT